MHQRYDKLLILLFIVISFVAGLTLGRFSTNYEFRYTLPQTEEERELASWYKSVFGERQVLVVALDDRDGSAADEAFELLRNIPGVSVVAPESVQIPVYADGDLDTWIAAERLDGQERRRWIQELLTRDSFLSSLFRSNDGNGRILYLYDLEDGSPAVFMDRVLANIPDTLRNTLRFWGGPYFNSILRDRARRDTIALIPIAAVLIFLAHAWMAKDIKTGLCLWSVSVIPALWTLALYPISGTVFRNDSILVPVQILALSTSYAIQYYRHAYRTRHQPTWKTGHGVSPIILLSGGTTILGFSSLFFIPLSSVRFTAAFIISGITFAILSALLLLPALLRTTAIFDRQVREEHSLPVLVLARIPFGGLILSILVITGTMGTFMVQARWSEEQFFRRNDPYTNTAEYYNERFGGMDEITLVINTKEPYFFIDPERYVQLRNLGMAISQNRHVSMVLDAPAFVDWTFKGLNGVDIGPSTMEEIGETIELAGSSGAGLSLSSLLSPEASATRLLIRFSTVDMNSYVAFEATLVAMASQAFPEADITSFSIIKDRLALRRFLVAGMIMGILSFMPTLLLIFAFYFRSLGMAIQAIIPPLAALGIYFGMAGWLGVALDPIVAVGAAAVMGVGVDDVIHLLLTARNGTRMGMKKANAFSMAIATAGSSIVQTTIIIMLGLLILLFSAFVPAAWTGLLSMISLGVATAVTLMVVPRLPFGLKDGNSSGAHDK
jgi:predicted RND superfamily exporter protein